jgi:Cupin-like domain
MLTLQPIEKRSGLTRDIFLKEHLEPLEPVVFTDLMDNWAAKTEWTIDNLKRKYGHFNVPIVTPNYSKPGKGYMEPELHMSFGEYLTLMERGKMPYRIFLWNIFRQAPEMVNDFTLPTIMDGFLKDFPFMFFGGQGSITPMHFDLDLSHVFLNQLHGRKRIVLFSHDDSKRLYHHPYTVASYVDINKPDYEKFPALSQVKGWETVLNPGETVFIPTGFWHYIEYVDGGYSIALRANESYVRRAKGAYQIAKHFVVDKSMNKILGSKWREMKEDMAKRRANEFF